MEYQGKKQDLFTMPKIYVLANCISQDAKMGGWNRSCFP